MDPRSEEIRIEDIAHSLSMQCRYAGHCKQFYSVAEHSCHLHDFVSPEHRAWALLHDASEAYLVDVPRPVKPFLSGYKEAENNIMKVIAARFGLGDEPMAVKEADGRILADEASQNMTQPPAPWTFYGYPLGITLQYWRPEQAKTEFLLRFYSLSLIEKDASDA
jgi:hypothetical protein